MKYYSNEGFNFNSHSKTVLTASHLICPSTASQRGVSTKLLMADGKTALRVKPGVSC